jgi:hypothetical protein
MKQRLFELNKQIDERKISNNERKLLLEQKRRLLAQWDAEKIVLNREAAEDRAARESQIEESQHKRGLRKEERDDESGAAATLVRQKERKHALRQRLFEVNKQIDDRRISTADRKLLLAERNRLLEQWEEEKTMLNKEAAEARGARMGKINQATHERRQAKEERKAYNEEGELRDRERQFGRASRDHKRFAQAEREKMENLTLTMQKIKLELEKLNMEDDEAVFEATRKTRQEVKKLEQEFELMKARFLAEEGLDRSQIQYNNIKSWPNTLMKKWEAWMPESVRTNAMDLIKTVGKIGLKVGTKVLTTFLGMKGLYK